MVLLARTGLGCHSLLQLSSATQSCPTLCDPMDGSMPGFPVHHKLLELAQTHIHRIGDAIQPSYPPSSPSSAFNLSKHQGLFQEVSSSHQVAKYWSFSFSISPSNSLLLWNTFCQNSLLWPFSIRCPCMTWLITSLNYASPFPMARLWSMRDNYSIEANFNPFHRIMIDFKLCACETETHSC